MINLLTLLCYELEQANKARYYVMAMHANAHLLAHLQTFIKEDDAVIAGDGQIRLWGNIWMIEDPKIAPDVIRLELVDGMQRRPAWRDVPIGKMVPAEGICL